MEKAMLTRRQFRFAAVVGFLLMMIAVWSHAENCVRLDITPFPTLQFGTMTTVETKTLTLRLGHPGGFFTGGQEGDLRLEKFFFSKSGSITLSDDEEVIRGKNEFYD